MLLWPLREAESSQEGRRDLGQRRPLRRVLQKDAPMLCACLVLRNGIGIGFRSR